MVKQPILIPIAVVILGAFLPWVSIFGISKSGIDGDGSITLVVALIGGVLVFIRKPAKHFVLAQGILAGIVAVVALADMNGFAAIGLYLTLLGGLAWLALCIPWHRIGTSAPPAPPAPPADIEPTEPPT